MIVELLSLIEALKAKQNGRTDEEFAKDLGIERTTWTGHKNLKSPPGMELCRAIYRVFPDLSPLVEAYMKVPKEDIKQSLLRNSK